MAELVNKDDLVQVHDAQGMGPSALSPMASGGNTLSVDERRTITIENLTQYVNDLFETLKAFCDSGSPLIFVLVASVADFVSCATQNEVSTKDNLRKFFYSLYLRCRSSSIANRRLSDTLVEILRNGLVHNFSTNPPGWDKKVQYKQVYEIILAHRRTAGKLTHLSITSFGEIEMLCLVAEDMVEDLECYAWFALSDPVLQQNMVNWCSQHPPVADFNTFSR
ncbi:hypothetical protein AAE485_03380 [Acidithiobacillus ferriphilus]|uniref:hypothetical protein n=1 Tax=Acidithiobacillus ferriphilus TaxID=1689834 RepID=UPI00390C7B5B